MAICCSGDLVLAAGRPKEVRCYKLLEAGFVLQWTSIRSSSVTSISLWNGNVLVGDDQLQLSCLPLDQSSGDLWELPLSEGEQVEDEINDICAIDEKSVAAACDDGIVYIINCVQKVVTGRLEGHGNVCNQALSLSRTTLLTCGFDCLLLLWSLKINSETFRLDTTSAVQAVTDGQMLNPPFAYCLERLTDEIVLVGLGNGALLVLQCMHHAVLKVLHVFSIHSLALTNVAAEKRGDRWLIYSCSDDKRILLSGLTMTRTKKSKSKKAGWLCSLNSIADYTHSKKIDMLRLHHTGVLFLDTSSHMYHASPRELVTGTPRRLEL